MRVGLLAGILIILVIFMIILVRNFTPSLFKLMPSSSLELKIESLSTDKELYHSNEPMNITLEISSSNKIDNVTVNVFGIKDRMDNYRINRLETVNLTNGINFFTYSYITPPCYGCAGIDAGMHDITAIVSYQEINLNSTVKIDIER